MIFLIRNVCAVHVCVCVYCCIPHSYVPVCLVDVGWGSINNQKNREWDTVETATANKNLLTTRCMHYELRLHIEYCVRRPPSFSLPLCCWHDVHTWIRAHTYHLYYIGIVHVEPSNFQQHANSFSAQYNIYANSQSMAQLNLDLDDAYRVVFPKSVSTVLPFPFICIHPYTWMRNRETAAATTTRLQLQGSISE